MRIDETSGAQQAEGAVDAADDEVVQAAVHGEEGRPSRERPPTPPRIYLASLTDYNAGVLHGRWVDADHEAEILGEVAQEMLAQSPTAER